MLILCGFWSVSFEGAIHLLWTQRDGLFYKKYFFVYQNKDSPTPGMAWEWVNDEIKKFWVEYANNSV